MFLLVKFGILSKKLLALQDSQPLCDSCLFGKSHIKGWRTKGDVQHNIRQDDDNNPGDGTSTDQIVSAQSGLVHQTSGRLTRSRIWGNHIMVYHFSNFIYVHVMSSISVEDTLADKKSYEQRAASYVVNVNIYHADNG